jgi:exonuclease SbcC
LELTGKRLVAVVGHTGAGKSSLLEAITFALFGEATYGGKAYEELSSDGRTEMTVQLTFTRGDERYQLLRTVAPDRNGKFGNKVVYLRRVDGEGNILSHTERVRDVDRAVSSLLGGMTREQFCQAVLLAQNRFAALLEANPADRDRLLDTLLGLNALSQARTALQKTRSAAARNIERLQDRRSNLPENPAADARAAKARAKAMNDVAQRAERCGTELDNLAEQASSLTQQAAELEGAAALRTTQRGPSGIERLADLVANLESLTELDDNLSAAEENAATELEQARRRLAEANEELAKTEAQHGTSGRHPVVAQQIDTLTEAAAEKPGREQAIAETQTDVERMGREQHVAQDEAIEKRAETERRQQAHQAAHEKATQAAAAAERSEQAVSSAASIVRRLVEQVDTVEHLSEDLDATRMEQTAAEDALGPLIERQMESQQALEASIRSDSAAAASHGCHPGVDCPVCGRVLPKSWAPPTAVDLDAARKHAASAEATVRTATNRQRRASEAHVDALARLRSALGAVVGTYNELPALAANQGLASPPTSPTVLGKDDEGSLGHGVEAASARAESLADWLDDLRSGLVPLQQENNEAAMRLKAAADQLALAQNAEYAAEEALGQAGTELVRAETRHNAAVEALESFARRLSATLSGIDKRWQVLVDLDRPDSLETAKQTLTHDQVAVDAAVQRSQQAQTTVGGQENAIHELVARRAKDVTAPLTGARTDLRTLTELVNDLCGRLNLPIDAAINKDAGARALHGAASALETVARRAAHTATERSAELRKKVDELMGPAAEVVSALVTLMADADPESTTFGKAPEPGNPLSDATRRAVQQVVGGARRIAAEAASQAKTADTAVKTAKELDDRLTAIRTWAADLDGAIEVLKKERFPRWARGLKMADLVETASEHLSEMTASRFRFDTSLQISDEVAGVIRKASTLSGGEKFEASLALALGVSEIAGRSGIRIETLFLDEGFAGLDQAHLNRALDALEREVEAGRNIVVITHIGAVADRIDDVLLIQPDGTGGSKTKWLDEDERFELGADLDLAVP